jgi:hypothetical protein
MPILEGFAPVGGTDQAQPSAGGALKGFEPDPNAQWSNDSHSSDDEPKKSGALRRIGDLGVDALKGLAGMGQAVKGLGALGSGNTAAGAMEEYRQMLQSQPELVRPPLPEEMTGAQVQEDLSKGYGSARQAAEQQVQQAQGVGNTAAAAIRNPSVILGQAVQMAPMLAAGIASGPAAPLVFGAQAGGTAAQNVLDKDPNNTAGAYEAAGIAAPIAGATVGLGGKFLTPAAEALGARVAGDFLGRAAGVVVDQGTQNAAMGAGSRIGENVGNGEEWSKDVAQHIPGDFAVGAVAGLGLRPFMGGHSALPDANKAPTADPVAEAINPALGQQGEMFPINPYNVGGHVDEAQQGHDFAVDAGPQGDLFDQQQSTQVPPNPMEAIRPGAGRAPQEVIDQNLGIGREPATTKENVQAALDAQTPFMGHEPQTQVESKPITQGDLFDIRENPQVAQAKAAQDAQGGAEREAAIMSLFAKVGPRADIVHSQLGETVIGAHRFNGEDHGTTPDFNKKLDKMLSTEADKTPVQHDVEQALSDVWREERVSQPDSRTDVEAPYPTMKDIDGYTKLTGINEAPTVAQAAAKIDLAIKKLQFSKAQTSLDKVRVLTAWRNRLIGEANGSNPESVNQGVKQPSEGVAGQREGAVGQPAEGSPAQAGSGAQNAEAARTAQGAEGAQLPGSQPGDVRAGPAQAAEGVTPPAARTGGTIKLNRRMQRGQQGAGQLQADAGDAAGRVGGMGPVAVRPAGERGQPARVEGGAPGDGSTGEARAGVGAAPGDAAVRSGGDGAGEGQVAAPADSKAKNEARDNLWREALKGGKKADRDFDILQAHFVDGLSHSEIAAKFGLDKSTVTKLVSEKTLGPKVLAAAHRLGYTPEDIMHMLRDEAPDAKPETVYDAAEGAAKAEDATPAFSDDRRIEGNELHGNEDTGAVQSMGTIKSAGGSQSKWKDTGDLTDQWLKAQKKGDTAKLAALEQKAKEDPNAWMTSSDRGRERWEAHEEEFPSSISYDDLPESLRDDWDEFVANGHGTLKDKAQIVNRLDTGDYEGAYESRELNSLAARFGRVEDVKVELRRMGIDHAFGAVDHWTPANLPDGVNGKISLTRNGETVVQLSTSILMHGDLDHLNNVMSHELWHGVDQALHGGVYSIQPEMRVERTGAGIEPVGEVATELHRLWANDAPDGAWRQYFDYPFNTDKHPDLNRQDVQAELFAQLASLHSTEGGREALAAEAPAASKYMGEVVKNVKDNPESVQSREDAGAQQRAETFGDRAAQGAGAVRHEEMAEAASRESLDSRDRDYEHESVDERRPAAERVISALPDPVRGPVQKTFDTLAHATKRGVQMFTFGHDLADWAHARLGMEAPQRYMDLHNQQDAYRRALDDKLGAIGSEASKLSGPQRDLASTFLTESTMSQKWGYQPSWKSDAVVDAATKKKFDALPADVQAVIKAVNEHGHEQRAQLREANDEIRKMLGDESPRLAGDKELPGPYLPLRRHGDFVVEAKSSTYKAAEALGDKARMAELKRDPQHYTYSQTRTMGEAKALARELGAKFGKNNVDAMGRDQYFADNHGASWQQLQKWRAKVDDYFNNGGEGGKELADQMNAALTDMYLQSIAETSARAGEMGRGNVAGVIAKQGLESFFQNGQRHNQLVSSMLHGAKLADEMKAMAGEVEAGNTPAQRAGRRDIVNEFQKRAAAQMRNRPSRVMDNLLMFNSAWRLLTSPAHYLQYITQPVTMALPLLQGRHGTGSGWKELTSGMVDAARLSKGGALTPDVSLHRGRIGDERGMLAELQRSGALDYGHESDYGSPKMFSSNQVAATGAKVIHTMTSVARALESYNRIGSALAAYRLAHADTLERNGTSTAAHAAGVKYANDIIRQAYGDYSASNAPRAFMPGNTPGLPVRMMAQFKKFNVIHTALVTRLIHGAFKGGSKEERAAAAKSLGWMAAHYGVLAGAMGVPGAQLLGYLIQQIFSDSDVPEDQETYFRRAIGDNDLANVVLHGAPAAAGMDLTGRIGAGDILNPLGRVNVNGKTPKDTASQYLIAAMGPMGATAMNTIDGTSQMMSGDWYRGLQTMMPSGIRDGMKAYQLATEGLTNKRNDVLIAPEDMSTADVIMQGMGVSPMKVQDAYRNAAELHNVQNYFTTQTADLTKRYAAAYRAGDSDAMDGIRSEWSTMQDAQIARQLKPTPYSTLLRSPVQQNKRENNTVGGVQTARGNRAFVDQLIMSGE